MGMKALSGVVGGNATLFSEGLSNAIESGGLNSACRMGGPVFLPKAGIHALGVGDGGWRHGALLDLVKNPRPKNGEVKCT